MDSYITFYTVMIGTLRSRYDEEHQGDEFSSDYHDNYIARVDFWPWNVRSRLAIF